MNNNLPQVSEQEINACADRLMSFLDNSVCNLWAVETLRRSLLASGYTELKAQDSWSIVPGGKYFTTKNSTALIAWQAGTGEPHLGYKIIASHCDSPGFRIKPNPEIKVDGKILKLNTEVYGGPILYTWFDRPLSIAGKVVLKGENAFDIGTKLVKFKHPLLTIPHLAIHYNRQVNDGNPLSRQKDMLPVAALINDNLCTDNTILNYVAKHLNVDPGEILDCDLLLYDITPACRTGLNQEFISSGRIDDLAMVEASLTALTTATCSAAPSPTSPATRVIAVFDNEETGSGTKQGAGSPWFYNVLRRINNQLGGNDETFARAIASSFLISADNAHALHPNYVEKQDPTNHPVPGGGPVIKINANCKYMTDAESAAIFKQLCNDAQVPCQYFVNHSDVAGGSTLGNILTSQLELRGVDMGAPQWAMHSCRETMAAVDQYYTTKVFKQFFTEE